MRTAPLLALFAPSVVHAATLSVPSSTYANIQDAIDAAADGDVIEVAPGSYNENLWIDGVDLTIVGTGGSGATLLDPDDWTAVVIGDATVSFSGFEIAPRSEGQGFFVYSSTVTISDVDVHDCVNDGNSANGDWFGSTSGGGLYAFQATVTVSDSTFDNNESNDDSGGNFYAYDSELTITSTTVSDGIASSDGGGLYANASTVTIESSTFEQNECDEDGGGIHVRGGTALVVGDTTFEQNVSGNAGGGLYAINEGATTTVSLTDSTFDTNESDYQAPAVYASVQITSTNTTVTGHDTWTSGGAVYMAGSGAWNGAGDVFTGNRTTSSSGHGGVFYLTSTSSLSVVNGTFSANTSAGRGGAIYHASTGSVTLDGTTFSGNTASSTGGAIHLNDGSATLTDNSFDGNRGTSGGAVYGSGTDGVSAHSNLWCGNDATSGSGGALYLTGAGTSVDVRYNRFVENTATSSGGGVYTTGATVTPAFYNNTFVGQSGGAAYFANDATFVNNVIAWTASGSGLSTDSSARLLTVTYNDWYTNTTADLAGGLATATLDSTNLLVDPRLTAYSLDGDCTNDALWPKYGAPIVDTGDVTLTDPDGTRSDMGAYGGTGADATMFTDADGDGLISMWDCDDTDATVQMYSVYADVDGDGYGDPAVTDMGCPGIGWSLDSTDCDDSDATVSPGATEMCDLADNDCDGVIDEADAADAGTWYADGDDDGWGDASSSSVSCYAPAGSVAASGDCDDANVAVNPAATEICNSIDDDCDGTVDVGVDPASGTTYYADDDSDGYGDVTDSVVACSLPSGYSANAIDCDDTNGTINPSAAERCDLVDNDCDGATDENDAIDASTWYLDSDGDGWGDAAQDVISCDAPMGYGGESGDCNDADAAYHPWAPETCADAFDYNCDGSTGTTDADSDGTIACEDCNDADAAVNPAATETCNGIDDDCDGIADEADATDARLWYADADRDGYGDAAGSVRACDAPVGYTDNADDCDDTSGLYHPGAAEACDEAIDFNCDGSVGSADADLDGVLACNDCDDSAADVYPGADELCDTFDNDCDGVTDEDGDLWGETWYADADGDTYGNAESSTKACEQPDGFVSDLADCDDTDASVSPAGQDIPGDGIDQDCSGADTPADDPRDTDTNDPGNGDEDVESGGCKCDAGGAGPTPWSALLGLLFLARRRRA
jgi:predicted outer membrane repeat protein